MHPRAGDNGAMIVGVREVQENALLRRLMGEDWWRRMSRSACTDVAEGVKEWYIDKPDDWFDNPDPFPDGTSRRERPRQWMAELTQGGMDARTGWSAEMMHDGFRVSFMNPARDQVSYGLRLQQYGGTITPTRAKALTIPLTAEARGVRADKFPRELFVVKGEAAKQDPEKVGTLVWRDEAGALHAAFALRKSAEVKPLKERRGHDAIPSEGELSALCKEAFADAVSAALRFNK